MTAAPLFGGIEAGGTKFVLGVGRGPGEIVARTSIPTTSPDETIVACIDWFAGQPAIAALGIASFGPLILDPARPDHGSIGATPKPGWSGALVLARLSEALAVPSAIDTDVNGAALAEHRWGAAQGCGVAVYVTIGTGLGGGVIIDGRAVHGNSHPEIGHFRLARHPDDRDFAGTCPFHGDCAEGLVSGPAIIARWGASLSDLPADHSGHAIIADYLGQLCVTLQAMVAPHRIILGGGVSKAPGLIAAATAAATKQAAGYFPVDFTTIITAPGLGENSGLLGALLLAEQAWEGRA
jgi:fructokinase